MKPQVFILDGNSSIIRCVVLVTCVGEGSLAVAEGGTGDAMVVVRRGEDVG